MRNTCLLILIMCALYGRSQNLVINPSFEEVATCPNDLSEIELAVGWTGLWGSADLFNACDDDSVTVPFNALGNQLPFEGDGYAGLAFYPQIYKEYIQQALSAPLEPGILTYVSMRVSPGGFGIPSWTTPALAANHIGLRFSTVPLSPTDYGQLEFNAAALSDANVLSDTATWTLLSTSFVPDSAYSHLQVGCFFTDDLMTWIQLDPNGDVQDAYAFVDAICVAQQGGVCEMAMGLGGIASGRRPTGILLTETLRVPMVEWGLAGSLAGVIVRDPLGRVVMQDRSAVSGYEASWPLPHLACGQYVVELMLRDRPSLVVRGLKL